MNEQHPQFESTPKFYVGFCKLCGTGPLGLRVCGDCGAVVIVCDECDAAWANAEIQQPPTVTGLTTLPCPHCHSDLFELPAHWADAKDVKACEWLSEAVKNRVVAVQEVKPLPDDQTHDRPPQ